MMSSNAGKRSIHLPVADFYEGKSILITGAAGYLGVILLEILLRTCPGIQSIYILLREKKGVQPECRKEGIFKKKIFYKLKEKQTDVFDKVHVVAGDVTLDNLGMSQEDAHCVAQQVSLVFHCAASISFMKPARFMAVHNALGTFKVIEFCRKLKKLDALVYTSTAYSNCNRNSEIEEMVYRLPFPAKRFLETLNNGNEESFERLVAECKPSWPNSYTFSKCLAENIILDYASDIPTAIVRPSIIVSCWKGILPGYIEEGSGMVDLGIAVGKGFIRVIHGDPDVKMNFVPVDVVANTHVAAAWSIATQRNSGPMVLNCVAEDKVPSTLQNFHDALFNMSKKNPLPRSFQIASSSIQKNTFIYWIMVLFEHYIPALVIDSLLRLSGHKPRLMSLYRFYDNAMIALGFFVRNSFKFQIDQLKCLSEELDEKDKEMFYLDTGSFTLESLVKEIPYGSPFYEWGIDRKPIGERRRITFVRYLFTSFIKGVVLSVIFLVFFLIFRLLISNVTV